MHDVAADQRCCWNEGCSHTHSRTNTHLPERRMLSKVVLLRSKILQPFSMLFCIDVCSRGSNQSMTGLVARRLFSHSHATKTTSATPTPAPSLTSSIQILCPRARCAAVAAYSCVTSCKLSAAVASCLAPVPLVVPLMAAVAFGLDVGCSVGGGGAAVGAVVLGTAARRWARMATATARRSTKGTSIFAPES